jgi:hypothetical protein
MCISQKGLHRGIVTHSCALSTHSLQSSTVTITDGDKACFWYELPGWQVEFLDDPATTDDTKG